MGGPGLRKWRRRGGASLPAALSQVSAGGVAARGCVRAGSTGVGVPRGPSSAALCPAASGVFVRRGGGDAVSVGPAVSRNTESKTSVGSQRGGGRGHRLLRGLGSCGACFRAGGRGMTPGRHGSALRGGSGSRGDAARGDRARGKGCAQAETRPRSPLHRQKRVLTFRLLCLSVYTCLINESRTFPVKPVLGKHLLLNGPPYGSVLMPNGT